MGTVISVVNGSGFKVGIRAIPRDSVRNQVWTDSLRVFFVNLFTANVNLPSLWLPFRKYVRKYMEILHTGSILE